MNEQELNKKLNEWAGTKDIDYTDPELGIVYCFKSLVPKLESYEIRLNHGKHCAWVKLPARYTEFGMAETPAHALCLAIEKLIDNRGRL